MKENLSQKFFIYARKSTDEKERQVLSIEAQLFELREYAKREGLHIAHEYIESKTAKAPGREVFNEMLTGIENGEASGIVAWHPDRLARNSVDGGHIIYLVDTGRITALKFPTFWFDPTPQGKFNLSIAFCQSKYVIDNLSENVKRGIRQKLRNGIWPACAPLGYINDKNKKCIIPDPKRAPLVKKTFELYATGEYSLADLRNIINDLGLVSAKGKKLSVSNFQYLLKNPIFYGTIRYGGELHEGTHKPIITKKLFDKCQAVMQRKSKSKTPTLKPYLYRGLFHCGECGCFITTETQKGHNYLRCTKRKNPCTQRYTREEIVQAQITKHIKSVSLPSEWIDWMIAENRKDKEKAIHSGSSRVQTLEKSIVDIDSKLERIFNMAIDGVLSDSEYVAKKSSFVTTKTELKEELAAFEHKSYDRFELTESFLKELNQAEEIATHGNFVAQRNFFKKIGSNPQLAEQTLTVTLKKPFAIAFKSKRATQYVARNDTNTEWYSLMRRVRDSNPRGSFPPTSLAGMRFQPDSANSPL